MILLSLWEIVSPKSNSLRKLLFGLTILALFATLASCSALSTNSKDRSWRYAEQVNETVNVDGKSYQIIDSETENLIAIKSTKTSFQLNQTHDTQAWERLAFYFKFYLGSQVSLKKEQLEVISDEGNFKYQITRKYLEDQSADYLVKVTDLKGNQITEESTIKAKNLARFLTEGILDQNLI